MLAKVFATATQLNQFVHQKDFTMKHKSILKRKIYIVLAISLLTVLLQTPVPGGLGQARANANNFILNNTVFGPNQDISISVGTLTFGCDDFYAVSDIYIVPRGSAVGNVDLKALDPSGVPNTLLGASGGVIAGELIGLTSPSGNITAGEWDVVEDVCQDGFLNPGDTVLSPGFTVNIDVDVPPLPAFSSLKSNAAAQRDFYYDHAWAFAHLIISYEAYEVVNAMLSPTDALLWIVQQFWKYDTGVDPSEAAIKALFNMSSYYQGIAADPPDPEFRQLSPLKERPILYPLDNDPLSIAAVQMGTAAGDEAELLRVLLASLERYQGAELAGNGDWALIHARAIRDYADVTAVHLLQTNNALAALEAALIADTRDFDSFAAGAVQFQNRIATSGFSDAEVREAANLGLSETDLAAIRADLLEVHYAFNKADFLSRIANIQAVNMALIADLNELSADMAPIVTTLENDPLVSDRAPVANAGGPYSGTVGTAVAFDATAAANTAAEAEYAWDLNGDGAFDDAVGASVNYTYTQPFTGLVGVKVTNEGKYANIAYAPIAIAPANARPTVTAFSPTDRRVNITLGNSQTFSVTAVDPDNDTLSVRWQIDGTLVHTGSSFSYTPGTADIGLHWIHAIVAEETPFPGAPVYHFWVARVVDTDNDGDGWHANVDCDDNNIHINPGMDEIIGNGVDDDCDITTSDMPPVPAFSFAPQTPLTNQVVQFTDASTDADGFIASWQWDFGDGITSTLQHPAHSYATAGAYSVTLQVTDNDGGIEQTSQGVTVYQQLGEVSFITSNAMNVARDVDGAMVTAVSSELNNDSYRAVKALDDSATSYWSTAAYQVTNQWIMVDLVGDEPHYVSQVTLKGGNTTFAARTFELFLSDTGTNEADFTSVLTGTIPQNDRLHTFDFAPAWATYAKLHLYDNWGSTQYTRLSVFRLHERPHEGGIVSLADGGPAARVVDSSGHYSTQDPGKALDTSLSTGWRPAVGAADGAWMTIELAGEIVAIDRIRLASTTARIKDFEVRVSATTPDDLAFTTVFSGTAVNDNTLQEFTFPAVTARYVQLIIHNTYTTSYLNVVMVQVLAKDGVNLASLTPLNATVVAYSSYANYPPNYAIDYDTGVNSSRWRSGVGQTTDQWLTVRLAQGGSYLVNRVYVDGYGTDSSPKDFEIRVSNNSLDDADFTPVFSGTMPGDGVGRYFTFPPVQARYVQIYMHNNNGNTSHIDLANFRVYAIDRGGRTVPFQDTSENQEGIVSWLWDFGDGNTATEQHPTHTYAAPGTYSVTLTIGSGIETASTTMLYHVPATGNAHFNQPVNLREGYSSWFTHNSTPAPGTVLLGYSWDFSVSTASGPGAYGSFPDNGNYEVSLTIFDSNLLYTTYTDTVSVANVAPQVNAGSNRAALALDPVKVHSDAHVYDVSSIDAASLVCDWDFGDGQTTQVQNCSNTSIQVTHVYTAAGVYTATVTLTDKDGGSDSDSFIATISKRDSRIGVVGMRSVTTDTAVVRIALVDDVIGNKPLAGYPVTISAAGQSVNATTNDLGIAEGTFHIANGMDVDVTAGFAGDGTYHPSSHSVAVAPAFEDELRDEYWLAFPSNWNNSGEPVLFIASEEDAVGVVTIAEINFVQPFTVTGGTAVEIQVPKEAYLSREVSGEKTETFSYKGIHVLATANIQVYGLATAFGTSDAYTGIPVEDLGTEYMVMTYRNAQVMVWDDTPAGEIAVVGIEPNTSVTLTLPGGAPITFTLDKGQVYQVVDNMKVQGGTDYTGAIVSADAPVAVFGGSNCTHIPSTVVHCDHLVEQMLPLNAWGWSYATMPLATRSGGDTFRILAAKDNTNVYINGDLVDTLNAAEFHEVILTAPSHITADQPVLVAQFSHGQGFDGVQSDPFMMLLPPYELAENYYPGISTPPSVIENNYLNLIVRNEDVGTVTLDGVAISPDLFVPIGGTGFSGAQLPISVGQHVLAGELPFSVYAYGFDYYNSFGYPGGGFRISDVALTSSITVTPATAVRPLGETHCVTAVVSDASGSPLQDVRVDLNRTGVHPAQGFAFTDVSGAAVFCYDGTLEGTDTLTVTTAIFSADATVSWVDNLDPIAVDDSATTDEDTAVTLDVLANDSDPDGDPLTVTAVTQPANGLVVINPDSSLTYTPDANYNSNDSAGLPDSFSYTLDDGRGGTATANVFVMATPVNDDPVAANDVATTNEDTAVTIDLLANDGDVDGDSLTIIAITTPALGSVVNNGDGTITYTPAADLYGTDSFSYTIADGNGGTASALVTIEIIPVNDPPMAVGDTAVVDEDEVVIIPVLDNDSDVDGDTIQLVAVTAPAHGVAVINPDGTITYTPYADYNGPDSFSYTNTDGNGAMATATVFITINPVNDAPIANDDLVSTLEDTAVTIMVLENDIDVDGDPLTVTITMAPAHGTAIVNPDGSITYTPNANYDGTDSLVYTVSDGLESDSAVVTITVTADNDNPVAVDDIVTTPEDTAVTIDGLANDYDVDGDTLTVVAVTDPANGTVVINPDGMLTYTPAADFNGSDSFVYTIIDGFGGADTALVTIEVTPVNDDPVANDDSATVNEDTSVTIAVLDNDSDVDGDSLSVMAVTAPANGTAVINPDSTITYTPDANFNGTDSFSYTVDDGNGGTTSALVTIYVNPVNDDPIALDDMVILDEGTMAIIAVLDNDNDIDGDTLVVTAVTMPAYGTAVINPDSTITYTPDANFNGADSFVYTISDGNGGTASAMVIIVVSQVSHSCELFPIALHQAVMADAQPGDILVNILNGEQPGNFGWLTWTGNTSTPALIDSLTLPGDSITYVNPNDASDHIVSAGDWVKGKPGVSNAQGVRAALDILKLVDIVVPVWDVTQGNGANAIYHITGFATIRILDYSLPSQDQITAQFIGFAACGG